MLLRRLLLLMVVSREGGGGMLRQRLLLILLVLLVVPRVVLLVKWGLHDVVELLRGARRGSSVVAHDAAAGSLWVGGEGGNRGSGTNGDGWRSLVACLCVGGRGWLFECAVLLASIIGVRKAFFGCAAAFARSPLVCGRARTCPTRVRQGRPRKGVSRYNLGLQACPGR